MWRIFGYMVILTMAAAASPALAEDGSSFHVKGSGQACVTGIKGDICHHYFEQDRVIISFKAVPMKANEGCPKITAELVQISTRLEAPLPEAVTPAAAGLCESRDFEVQLPSLQNETEFEVVFRQETGKDKWQDLKTISVKAYPRTLIESVKSWVEFKDNALIVTDKEGKLLDFLDRHKVTYLTRDTAPQGSRKVYIVTGKDAEEVEGNAIYLREKVDTLPVIKVRQTAQGASAYVRVKLIDALKADDPLAQKMFAKIFNEIAK